MLKNNKFLFMIFTLICFVAAGVCLIVDIAINRQITWAAYPLLSIPFGWALLLPLLIKKYGITLFLFVLTVLSLPYLYLLSGITPATDWFMPVGLPSAVTGMIALWILYPVFRYAKLSLWYKSAISLFLLGVVVSPAVNYFVDIYLETEPFEWYRWIGIFACAVASAALGIRGYRKSNPKPVNDQ